MKNKSNKEVIICACNSTEHQMIISHNEEEKTVYVHIHLVNKNFFKRLFSGLKYIFGYKSRFGNWDEFIFTKDHLEKLKNVCYTIENNR